MLLFFIVKNYNTKGSAPDQMIRGRALFVGMNFVTSPFAWKGGAEQNQSAKVRFQPCCSRSADKRPRYALKSKGSYIETVQPPSMAIWKTGQPRSTRGTFYKNQ